MTAMPVPPAMDLQQLYSVLPTDRVVGENEIVLLPINPYKTKIA